MSESQVENMQKVFPRLDLTPTIESTMIKLAEEVGECSEIVGKIRGMSGEDRGQIMLKLLSREMGREMAEVMSNQMELKDSIFLDMMNKYQAMREKAITGQFEDREIHSRIARELLDIMQTCATFLYQLEIDLEQLIDEHRQKLVRRGYLNP